MSTDKIHLKDMSSKKDRYFCMSTVEPREEFLTEDYEKVTCENCAKKIEAFQPVYDKYFSKVFRESIGRRDKIISNLKQQKIRLSIILISGYFFALVWLVVLVVGILI